MSRKPESSSGLSSLLLSIVLALCVAFFIWIASPYNSYLLNNSTISDTFLPLSALGAALAVALTMGVRPVWGRTVLALLFGSLLCVLAWLLEGSTISSPFLATAVFVAAGAVTVVLLIGGALRRLQAALILGLLLVAIAPTCRGLLSGLPYGLAQEQAEASTAGNVEDQYRQADLPGVLFPGPMERPQGESQSAASPGADFRNRLGPEAPIPWAVWKGPLISWGVLLAFFFTMTIGLAGVVYPQWRHNERLPFPLLTVQKAVVERSEGRRVPDVFTSRVFWFGFGLVFLVYLLKGFALYFPSQVPDVKINWYLGSMINEPPLRFLPWFTWTGRLFFVFIGVAFFMSNRIAFSIVGFHVIYAVWTFMTRAYAPTWFEWGKPADHRTGAMIVLTFTILYLGRAHWAYVVRSMFGLRGEGEGGRGGAALAGWLFVLGMLGMFGWFLWAGGSALREAPFSHAFFAAGMVVVLFIYALMTARVSAEAGAPVMGVMGDHFTKMMRTFVPVGWVRPATAWLWGMVGWLGGATSEGSTSVVALHALGLNDDSKTPHRRRRLLPLFLIFLLAGLLVAGAAHLAMAYRHSSSLDGMVSPLNANGYGFFGGARGLLQQNISGSWTQVNYSHVGNVAFGGVAALALHLLCVRFPAWPLHPLGFLMVFNGWGTFMWVSVMVGWAAKNLIVFVGGAHTYAKARPFFIGLILGELGAALTWALVSVVVNSFGGDYKVLQVLPW